MKHHLKQKPFAPSLNYILRGLDKRLTMAKCEQMVSQVKTNTASFVNRQMMNEINSDFNLRRKPIYPKKGHSTII